MANKGLSVDKALPKKAKKKRETWSQTKRIGDTTEEMNVEKLDNKGYLITISKSWYDSKGNWHNNDKKIYADNNPLDPDESDNPIDKLHNFLVGNKLNR